MNIIISELLKTKAHISSSKWNKEISKYLVGFRTENIPNSQNSKVYAIFDLEKTYSALVKVFYFFKNIKTKNPHIMLLTKIPGFHSNISSEYRLSIIQDKWIGGLFTNWKQISESAFIYSQFREKYGNFVNQQNIHFPIYQKYHKTFRGLQFSRSIYQNFESFQESGFPDLLIVTHPKDYEIALKEAHDLQIPIIAFVDSDLNPKIFSYINYIIPGNTKSPEFLLFCLNLLFSNKE